MFWLDWGWRNRYSRQLTRSWQTFTGVVILPNMRLLATGYFFFFVFVFETILLRCSRCFGSCSTFHEFLDPQPRLITHDRLRLSLPLYETHFIRDMSLKIDLLAKLFLQDTRNFLRSSERSSAGSGFNYRTYIISYTWRYFFNIGLAI